MYGDGLEQTGRALCLLGFGKTSRTADIEPHSHILKKSALSQLNCGTVPFECKLDTRVADTQPPITISTNFHVARSRTATLTSIIL
jgi:hypothetical protein